MSAVAMLLIVGCAPAAGEPADRGKPLSPTVPTSTLHVSPDGDDENAGTGTQPFRTIDRAAAAARQGVQIVIAPGTYPTPVHTQVSGTSTDRIAFVAGPGGPVVLTGSNTEEPVWRNTGDYVDIVGFEMSGDALVGLQNEGSYVRIVGNRVHDVPRGSCINSGAGDYSAHDIDVLGNTVWGCGRSRLEHGIYMSNPNGLVANNIAYGNSGFGIHCWHNCNALTITNNLVFANGQGGMVIGQGDAPNNGDVPADNFLVANNIVVANARLGIVESGATGPRNRYVNNLVWGNGEEGIGLQLGEQVGTIIADPAFVDFRHDGSGDYRLADGSPALDAGVSEGAPETDVGGVSRPQGRAVDLGPFER
ncbi:right-handed parallel beta-helix repeat-containing protein [Actinomycetospora rhizophila]|uniref:Right-handed parallel beta-helix repeat-containing protein n=1 Tax=Actinomycetospora rhizophila TaxID=1416876 RepID=A0ABV9ZR69_9PSEU